MRQSSLHRLAFFALGMGVIMPPMLARAQDDDDGKKAPDMHQLARSSTLPKAEADFSMFKYRPPGDKVIEQPDANRILFKRPDGTPDGYAQRRGNAIIYYDRGGKVSHVQTLGD